jgi:hypothetical protein
MVLLIFFHKNFVEKGRVLAPCRRRIGPVVQADVCQVNDRVRRVIGSLTSCGVRVAPAVETHSIAFANFATPALLVREAGIEPAVSLRTMD